MSHGKKSLHSWHCGSCNVALGLLIALYPVILLRNFIYAFCYMFLLCTLSSINTININKRQFSFSFPTSLTNSDDVKFDRFGTKKVEKKEFSITKVTVAFVLSVVLYYIVCILFGAPLFGSYSATLYFSSLMTLLTVYPLLWQFYFSDNLLSIFRIILDGKHDSTTESHLHTLITWSVVGAWLGAIPIPLDWDRPWQEWPITCCIGACVGCSAAHLLIGVRLLHNSFREKKKCVSNRSV